MKTYFQILIVCVSCCVYTHMNAQNASFPVIDAHCHFKISPNEMSFQTMEEYFADNKSVNIKYVFGITIARKGNMAKTKMQNDSLFAMAKRDPRFIPVCSVHPGDGDAAITELQRIKESGGKILKLHPLTQQFTILSEESVKVARMAGELGMVILIDGYGFIVPNYLENLWQLALSCPKTKFIIAHMGGTEFYKLGGVSLVQSLNPEMLNNVWYDLSAVVTIYADSPYKSQLEWVIRSVGTDKILFGSDQPVTTLANALKDFYKLDLNISERERILYKNAKELLELE